LETTHLAQITSKNLPKYENPPLDEVVCGVLFERLDKFLTPYLGVLWGRYKSDYSECREVAPLVPLIESFERTPQVTSQDIDIVPLPRIWFVHANGTRIIQVQRDRFLHNWRKVRPEDEYPHYETVIELFQIHLSTFKNFLHEEKLGTVTPLQYELTYVNFIPQGNGWQTLEDIGKIFPDVTWQVDKKRFLQSPDSIFWQTNFLLPAQAGRLHINIQKARRREDGHPLLRFELTARGIGNYTSPEAMSDWFDLAHEWAVRAFEDLTSVDIQREIWRRKRGT
jgi:uncharacterized protein (TIGR04255 family)